MIPAASELFSFCFSEHIPEDSDLIFAEFGERLCSIVSSDKLLPYIAPKSAVNDFP